MDNKVAFQLGDGVFWLSLAIGFLGMLVIAGVVAFAVWLKKQDQLVLPNGGSDENSRRQLATYYLENCIEFWVAYGQIILAILLIVALTILLLTKTITAEAGLPILSAIAGFAIAKGTSTARLGGIAPRQPPESPQGSQPLPKEDSGTKGFPQGEIPPSNPSDNPEQSPKQIDIETGGRIVEEENHVIINGVRVPKRKHGDTPQ
jgi:hypothetical protein